MPLRTSPCPPVRRHFGLAAVLLEFLTARDVLGAVDPDQMPASGGSLNQLALNCCVQANALIEYVLDTDNGRGPAKRRGVR